MNDENFDKIVREKIKKNVDMPEKINQLFLKFEKEVVNMEDYNEVNKKMKLSNYVRRGIAVISSGLVIFFGGCVYAHVNGTETIISPLLRNLGINSKYVENATQIGSEVTKNQVKVKMLDAAIDDVTLIVGYQIDIENNNPDAWIEINGEYKINDVNVKPNNTSIDRISDTTYVYYQIYDTNELKLDEAKSIKMNAKITEIKEYTEKMFDDIKHIDEFGNEYWLARELQSVLQYTEWRKFKGVIDKAKIACKSSGYKALDHFVGADKMVEIGSDTKREVPDYKLSRYAYYLISQNSNYRKKVIALAQTYFAIQTRKMELTEREYSSLTEEEKRVYQRNLTKKGNYSLNIAARNARVKNFDRFHNYGYKGLYNGETADDIAKRKKLRYREDILDNMGSEELIANLFRISQTESKLKRDNVNSESKANKTHYEVGSKIRNTIKELGGTMPEELRAPDKILKELEKENKKLKIDDCKYNIK